MPPDLEPPILRLKTSRHGVSTFPNLTLTLVAGYDAVLRKRVIDEWIVLREMVGKPAPGAPPVSSDPTLVAILAQLTRQGEETQKRIEFEGERNDRANRPVLDRV